MDFHSFDVGTRLFSVTIAREEAEDLRRFMKNIADNIDHIDKASIGMYKKEEAMVYVDYMDSVLASFKVGEDKARVNMSYVQLFDYIDCLGGNFDWSLKECCDILGLTSEKRDAYIGDMRNASETLAQPVYKKMREDRSKNKNPSL